MKQQAMLLADFYKLSHRRQYPEGTELVYSTWTPRDSRNKDIKSVVSFRQKKFIKEYLIDFFNYNLGIGNMKDNVIYLKAAIEYLEKNK